MDLKEIEDIILSRCPYIRKIKVIMKNNYPYAHIYPNFEVLKEANIINIENEIRWYGIELYNPHKHLRYSGLKQSLFCQCF